MGKAVAWVSRPWIHLMMSIVLLVAKKTRQSLIFRRRLEIVLQRKHASNEKSWTEEINTTINHFVAANIYS